MNKGPNAAPRLCVALALALAVAHAPRAFTALSSRSSVTTDGATAALGGSRFALARELHQTTSSAAGVAKFSWPCLGCTALLLLSAVRTLHQGKAHARGAKCSA